MNNFANNRQHVFVILIGLSIAGIVYFFLSGDGVYSFLFFDFNKNLLAKSLAFISFGLYSRQCYQPPVLSNEQGIERFFGEQTGRVFKESNLVFVAWPIWDIWKSLSVQHFSFTVAAQNRTQEGYSVMVFATGKAIPENAYLLAKMTEEGIREQVLGLSMMALGSYINNNLRKTLLNFQYWNVSDIINEVLGANNFYGLRVQAFTTKVIEVDTKTANQFEMLARQGDMESTFRSLRASLPNISDVELLAAYGSIVGITPTVMSYVIHGDGKNNIILGKGNFD